MEYRFEIPGTLPTLNDFLSSSQHRNYSNKIKRETQDRIISCLDDAPKFNSSVWVYFIWIRPDMRCDKDNVSFAKKFILDALQEAGVIKRDSWKMATPYTAGYKVNKLNPRTLVYITDVEPAFSIMKGISDAFN